MRLSVGGVLAVAGALCVAAACLRLGIWQLERLEQKRELNASIEHALSLPVLPLRDSLPHLLTDPARYAYRRAWVAGTYDPSMELVLRGRASRGSPGVNLLTLLRVAPESAILVNRGWVPSQDAASVDPRGYAEAGMRSIEGILILPPPVSGPVAPIIRNLGTTRVISVARLPLDSLRRAAAYVLPAVYLQQLPAAQHQDSLPHRLPLPELDPGPHRGYAVQWFSFAAIAVGGLALLLRRGRGSSDGGA